MFGRPPHRPVGFQGGVAKVRDALDEHKARRLFSPVENLKIS
jgi:hypothetical protein